MTSTTPVPKSEAAAKRIAAVDAGASRCRCVIVDGSGRVVGVASGPGGAFSPSRAAECAATIRRCVVEAAERAGAGLPLYGLALGVAGIGRDAERSAFLETLRPDDLAARVVATHDAETALWGAIPSGHGIIVIAGTGAIAFGRSRSGRRARAGGWGREIDDEGGAWWLGTRVLAAVMRAYDGRGLATALTAAALNATGCGEPEELITWLRAEGRTPKDVASLALLADEAAQAGDPVADRLLGQAADALAEMAVACHRSLAPDAPKEMALLGGLFAASAELRRRFTEKLTAAALDLAVVPPRLPAVFGAVVNFWHETGERIPDDLLATLESQIEKLPGDWGYDRRD